MPTQNMEATGEASAFSAWNSLHLYRSAPKETGRPAVPIVIVLCPEIGSVCDSRNLTPIKKTSYFHKEIGTKYLGHNLYMLLSKLGYMLLSKASCWIFLANIQQDEIYRWCIFHQMLLNHHALAFIEDLNSFICFQSIEVGQCTLVKNVSRW